MRHAIRTFAMLLASIGMLRAADLENHSNWKDILNDRLPYYGHRNWIVIADSAYPAQSRVGIETVVSGAGQNEVIQYVLHVLASAKHVRPNIFLDRELEYVPEADAPGIDAYRTQLKALLAGREVGRLPHEQIISKLDAAGQTFRVLIIKTNLTVPYTSVFLQLDCAYWSAEAEQRLRDSMAKKAGR
ncbi:MAG: hypothetical protein M3Y72_12445 [Acidobacteriota bacterium]|nr:hypothetical protein [Acidobacteriota bacterium]